jgi:decaprenylphospho-beta-D-ribofuranose 2-oxidase
VTDTVLLTGWGRTAPTAACLRGLEALEGGDAGPRGVIARGLGRAYGDAAQNAGGAVIDMTAHDRLLSFEGDTVTVEAGMSLGALISHVLPSGWFVPVTPGTQHVTVGGAIASDVHGKNHHRDGSFGRHVTSLKLVSPSGSHVLEPGSPRFDATFGGMGLTGVVTEATLRLLPVESAWVREDIERCADVDDCMARMSERDDDYRYSVAWIDCLARGGRLGRSVLMRGDHAPADAVPAGAKPLARRGGLRVPALPWAPNGLLRRETVAAFNEVYFRRAPALERGRLVGLDPFFYPLDAVTGWNRMYGSRGFLQYQFVVPFGSVGEDALREALRRLSEARVASFLAVLKRFGPGSGMISFPMPGWTLALDMPAGDPSLGRLLDGLDSLVASAGGRVYLSKDSRLRPELLGAMYPELDRWRDAVRALDPASVMQSDLSRRLGLVA